MSRQQENRIANLEARAIDALDIGEHCPTCGGPKPAYHARVIMEIDGAETEPRCPECGLWVDDSGRVLPGAIRLQPGEEAHLAHIIIGDRKP